jgi:two-component system OmpR family sensor kinase
MKLAWPRRHWTLRGRLLVSLLALLAAVCVVIGVVSVTALADQTRGQVDRQLQAAGARAMNPYDDHGGRGGGLDGDGPSICPRFIPGQAAGTVSAVLINGSVACGQVLNGGFDSGNLPSYTALPPADYETLLGVPADGRPHTITLAGFGEYRVLVAPGGPNGGAQLTGLPLKDANSTVGSLTLVIIIVGACGLLGAGIVGSIIVRFALRPLRRVADTATRVSKLQLDRGEVALQERVPEQDTDPHTEVGQVGAALNSMLGHVATALSARHASEMRVRQFVADASHELRTPLASIRGYAELTRRTGRDIPEDIRHAMNRVESEATRMTGLVEDLLLLARLDAGRPVEQEPVDLSAVVIDAVSDAHAAGPDHPVSLVLPDEPVEVIGDAARLHQVIANLLTNTRTHTAPGTAVRVTLRREPPEGSSAGSPPAAAVVEVADQGPGIPPELLPHIFERFARADSSRSRNAGSTGLGLAIVSAVVAAHGGTVDVRSRPGETVFAVRLPAVTAAELPRVAPPLTCQEPAI